ncbi:hypothetical protein ACHAXR_008135 [Thalassiosira sp. AJA248-18]
MRIKPTASIRTTASSSIARDAEPTVQEASYQLLEDLQRKAAPNSKEDLLLDNSIKKLVQYLISSKTPFDPSTSIDGPLFASVYFIGDTPLWAKIGAGAVRNVKGQKYTLEGDTSGTFANYAEILGKNFYLKAVGDFSDEGPVQSIRPSSENESQTNNPLVALASLFSPGNGNKKQQSKLLPTPYDYSATVTGASIVLFQQFSLDLSIEGTGTVRVLYADENLRIFLSPTDTNVTKGGGDWESEGLIVVQVRVDLVYADWTDRL